MPLSSLLINTEVHIDGVSDAYILLVEEALKTEWWSGSLGRYRLVVDAIAKDLHGKGAIKSPEVERMSVAEASKHHPWAGLM
jgi:hypothetical protein